MRHTPIGTRITHGPMDWQILQRRLDNKADIHLAGTWKTGDNRTARAEVRVVQEDTNTAVSAALDWHYADTRADGTWEATLTDVPAGGPYRIETRLQPEEDSWRLNGDRLHHIGVGDLWVIAGQSNAVGYGHGPANDPIDMNVHLFRPCEEWGLADHPLADPTRTRHPASFDPGWADHSPWLAFGRHLTQTLHIPIGLIPTALGGSPLTQWNPQQPDHPLFDNMLDLIRTACAECDYTRIHPDDGGPVFLPSAHGEVGRIAGIVWYQGCSDSDTEENASTYDTRFLQFVEGTRNALDAPSLPFITCQLNRAYMNEAKYWNIVREAQRRVAHDHPFIGIVPTLDLGLSDFIHTDAQSNVRLGKRAADAALGMIYGQGIAWKAPDIAGAGFDAENRGRVVLYFENVTGELWQTCDRIEQFAVEDESGPVGIEAVHLWQPDRILLELIRPVGDGAVVHNGDGANPPVGILDNAQRPLLAFHGIGIG